MEQEIRTALERFSSRVRETIDAELDGLAAELMRAAESAAQRSRAESEARLAAREAGLRTDIETRLTDELQRQFADQLEAARVQARAEALTQARQELSDSAARDTAAREEETAAAARASEREARLEAVERLLASVRRIDAASTLRETLEVLTQSASLETPRVAVLLIEGTSVRTFSHRGFDEVPPAGPIAPGGVVEACVQQGQPAFTNDAAGLRAPGFAALDEHRAGFAVPLRVGGRTVAVLYADDAVEGAHDAPAAWPEALELLARHASMHLENLTATRAAGVAPYHAHDGAPEVVSTSGIGPASTPDAGVDVEPDEDGAKRYARLLISEIKLYNEPAVREGRERRDLRQRLADGIERARRAYYARIPETVASRDRYFEAELVNILADGDPSRL